MPFGRIFLFFLLLIFHSGALDAAEVKVDIEVEEALKRLTLKQKVGQLFIFGFTGTELNRGLEKTISDLQPGAIVVFGRNIVTPRQTMELNYRAQLKSFSVSGLPLLIAVDQEGGNVVRVRTVPSVPSALALAESGSLSLVNETGFYSGKVLRALGFNMNLAPVVDVADPNEDAFIGTRTFGNDPIQVTNSASTFADGLRRAKIFPTAKHFPGHGGINDDSHKETPTKFTELDEMMARDLVPFNAASKPGSDWAMMVAHISYPRLDPTSTPATFSKPIVTGILREKLKFDGVVMTDDIEMAGAFAVKDVKERAILAIEAGVDMVMVGWDKKVQKELVNAMESAVLSKRISEYRIDQSVRRILLAKKIYAGLKPPAKPKMNEMAAVLRDDALLRVSEKVAETCFAKSAARKSLSTRRTPTSAPPQIILFSATNTFTSGFRNSLSGRKIKTVNLGTTTSKDIENLLMNHPQSEVVFYITGTRSAALLNKLDPELRKRIYVINSEARSYLRQPEDYRQVIDVYFRHPATGRLTAQHLFGGDNQRNSFKKDRATKSDVSLEVTSKRPRRTSSQFRGS